MISSVVNTLFDSVVVTADATIGDCIKLSIAIITFAF
jgi:hypothetical protein